MSTSFTYEHTTVICHLQVVSHGTIACMYIYMIGLKIPPCRTPGLIAGLLVPYNHACPKWGLIHRDRVMQLMKQALYLQATMAGSIKVW